VLPTFRRKILPPSSAVEELAKRTEDSNLFAGCLHCLFFGFEDGGSVFLRNLVKLVQDYTESRPKNSTLYTRTSKHNKILFSSSFHITDHMQII
jgi:hypothetical protein